LVVAGECGNDEQRGDYCSDDLALACPFGGVHDSISLLGVNSIVAGRQGVYNAIV
jgi:hypothetical protein